MHTLLSKSELQKFYVFKFIIKREFLFVEQSFIQHSLVYLNEWILWAIYIHQIWNYITLTFFYRNKMTKICKLRVVLLMVVLELIYFHWLPIFGSFFVFISWDISFYQIRLNLLILVGVIGLNILVSKLSIKFWILIS